MNLIQPFGIERAYSPLLPAVRGFYAIAHPTWRLPCQVSGRFHSGIKPSSLSSSPRFICRRKNFQAPPFGDSRSPSGTWRLRRLKWAAAYLPGIRLAGMFPGCAPNRTGRRSIWRHSCNARAWTPAATCSPVWSCASPGSTLNSCWVCNGCSVFPSSVFSRNPFKTWTPFIPNTPACHCPNLTRQRSQRNPGANAKS